MLIGPKYKICKRLGASVFEKCQTQKFQVAESRSPRRSRGGARGSSNFGVQLLEKQKARFTYGLSEKQFSRYAKEAMEQAGNATVHLLSRLESRLDNVVYRAGLAPTRRASRQLVSHGHITVGGRRVTIPSYQVSEDDIVAVRLESRKGALFGDHAEKAPERQTPSWLALEEGGLGARVTAKPVLEQGALAFDPAVIIQFYSR